MNFTLNNKNRNMRFRIEIYDLTSSDMILYTVELRFPLVNDAITFAKQIIEKGQGFHLKQVGD